MHIIIMCVTRWSSDIKVLVSELRILARLWALYRIMAARSRRTRFQSDSHTGTDGPPRKKMRAAEIKQHLDILGECIMLPVP